MEDSYSGDSAEEDPHEREVAGDDAGEDWSGRKKIVKRFSPAQTASLRANYNNGMVGIGKQYQVLMEKAATDAMLTINQVKVHYFFTITVLICHAPGYF